MKWDLVGNVRCDIHAYTGTNICGNRQVAQIFPSGVKGDLDGARMQSCILIAPIGTRVTLFTGGSEVTREMMPWRAVEFHQETTFEIKGGKRAIRILDLDLLNAHNATRVAEDFQQSYPEAESLEDRQGWTYGHRANILLKDNIKSIRVEKLPPPDED
ncbi:MAG: hypothetical protein H6739_17860 [Alphaproteobacteria bacterium]|nr:hypothetical protein [Alphaproteobacteria bacterium]